MSEPTIDPKVLREILATSESALKAVVGLLGSVRAREAVRDRYRTLTTTGTADDLVAATKALEYAEGDVLAHAWHVESEVAIELRVAELARERRALESAPKVQGA